MVMKSQCYSKLKVISIAVPNRKKKRRVGNFCIYTNFHEKYSMILDEIPVYIHKGKK